MTWDRLDMAMRFDATLAILEKKMAFEFLKRLTLPKVQLSAIGLTQIVGIDVGISSVKVVQLKKESEHAVLETYGELKTGPYLKEADGAAGGGFLRFQDSDVAAMLKDVMKESNVTTDRAVIAVPAVSSFVTMVELPSSDPGEIKQAVPFEARKYIPIPISEVLLDWQIIDEGDQPTGDASKTKVLLVAVPKEVINKFNRVAELAGIHISGLEVETFSLVRSLVGHDKSVTAIVNIGSESTTIAVVDRGVMRLSHNIDRGSDDVSNALARGLGVGQERAVQAKHEIGLSDRPEDRESASVIIPIIELLLAEIERVISAYNRTTERKIERITMSGGGSKLKGLVDYTAKRFGVETIEGNPFRRITYPAFMQPILKDIAPSFGVAVGLALREITPK